MAINKYAVLVGCNYPNTRNELHGCVNDVLGMQKSLIQRFGFASEYMDMLIDTDTAHTQPTGQNICLALLKMVEKAKPGDVLFFHYSGHGTLIPKENNGCASDEGYDECIVPCDFNFITDEDFRLIVNQVPLGATFTMVSDSCHSGGLIDKEKEQIGPATETSREILELQGGYAKNKFLPLASLLEILREKTGNAEIEVGKIRVALYDLFGDKASSNVKVFVNSLLKKLRSDINETAGTDHAAALELLKQNLEKAQDSSEYARPALDHVLKLGRDVDEKQRVHPDMGILLSGCQTDETSADACPTGDPNVAFGAFTHAIQTVLERHADPISNRELVLGARKLLGEEGFSQHPCLYCSDQNAQAAFLCEKSQK
eukprot:Gb_08838 [translate_table: standard]